MSEKPEVGGTSPFVGEIEAGEYWWCACGKSKNQPYCDGSHQGGAFTPLRLEVAEKRKVALCTCKATSNPPYCDGSHKGVTQP